MAKHLRWIETHHFWDHSEKIARILLNCWGLSTEKYVNFQRCCDRKMLWCCDVVMFWTCDDLVFWCFGILMLWCCFFESLVCMILIFIIDNILYIVLVWYVLNLNTSLLAGLPWHERATLRKSSSSPARQVDKLPQLNPKAEQKPGGSRDLQLASPCDAICSSPVRVAALTITSCSAKIC